MRKIYKYPLEIIDEQKITLERGYQLLHIGEQDGKLFLWALVDTNENYIEKVTLFCYATGENINDHFGLTHFQTTQMSNGQVYHFFRV